MSDRLRNNLVAGFIVVAFWIVFVLPVMAADPIVTNSTSNSTVTSNTTSESTVKTNPPSAISPSINASNSDLCTVGVSGAVQTQIIGISTGQAYRDANCERLKIAKVLYDMGMKVAAVSVMCQDWRTYDAMEKAGTPCPIMGKIGEEAEDLWKKNRREIPKQENLKTMDRGEFINTLANGIISVILLAILVI
jgi:hypothetical protein